MREYIVELPSGRYLLRVRESGGELMPVSAPSRETAYRFKSAVSAQVAARTFRGRVETA